MITWWFQFDKFNTLIQFNTVVSNANELNRGKKNEH